jgi:hypothetical protein
MLLCRMYIKVVKYGVLLKDIFCGLNAEKFKPRKKQKTLFTKDHDLQKKTFRSETLVY